MEVGIGKVETRIGDEELRAIVADEASVILTALSGQVIRTDSVVWWLVWRGCVHFAFDCVHFDLKVTHVPRLRFILPLNCVRGGKLDRLKRSSYSGKFSG